MSEPWRSRSATIIGFIICYDLAMSLKDPEARRAYHREYMRAYLQDPDVKAKHLARVKRNSQRQRESNMARVNEIRDNPCTDCGQRFPLECMEFDHVGSKAREISRLIAFSWKTIEAELKKCELVCANCHKIRTFARAGWKTRQQSGVEQSGSSAAS